MKVDLYAPRESARVVARIAHLVLGESLGEIASRVASGAAFLSVTFFHNDHLEEARKVLELIRQANEAGVSLRCIERDENNPADVGDPLDLAVLSRLLRESLDQYR